jgi:hypothetical protein
MVCVLEACSVSMQACIRWLGRHQITGFNSPLKITCLLGCNAIQIAESSGGSAAYVYKFLPDVRKHYPDFTA